MFLYQTSFLDPQLTHFFYWVGTIEKTKRIYRFQGFDFNRRVDFDLTDFFSLSLLM